MKTLHGLPLLLVTHLKPLSWVSKGYLTADKVWVHQRGKSAGKRYLPETVGRALRSLEEQKIIAVRDSGISVEYKYLPLEYRERYIPSSSRPDSAKGKLFRERQQDPMELEGDLATELPPVIGSLPYKE
jgi:hypothetical protein